ncbi:MAG: SDR family oxidoreductase [SAR324 cluster bacterium]|nr:SDR family oxidoreductase [SAR324 cluster bacterium]
MKTILVAGATGQTGRLVVEQSLANDHKVRIIVRSCNRLPAEILEHPNINLVEASELDLSDEQIVDLVKGYDAVVSCLGHVISFKGIFGEPKQLCTEATKRLCEVIESSCQFWSSNQ